MPINFGVTSTLIFPVWLRNRIISAGSEPIHSHTEKSCLASLKNMNHKINSSFVRPVGGYKTGFNLINFHFNTRGKLLPITRKQGVKMRYLENLQNHLIFELISLAALSNFNFLFIIIIPKYFNKKHNFIETKNPYHFKE